HCRPCFRCWVEIRSEGRLLAVGMEDGARLLELPSGRELTFLPIGNTSSVLFQPEGRELITCGPEGGLQLWQVQGGEGGNEIRLGPPRRIRLPFAPLRFSRKRDGRILAAVSETSG